MLKSIATVSLGGSLQQKLSAVASAGFAGVEIFEADLLSFGGNAKELRDIIGGLGLKIVAFRLLRGRTQETEIYAR